MSADPKGGGGASATVAALQPLSSDGASVGALEVVERLGMFERPTGAAGRPRVLVNMISSLDGRATLAGRSGPLSGPGDRQLFHALRTACDAVLVGAATVRMERYGRMIRDESRRRLRGERGLAQEPLACVVSGRLEFPQDIPLLADPQARVVVLTPSEASLPSVAAQVEYVRARREGRLDVDAALAELRERFAVQLLLCEGGPHLVCELLAAGVVDELFVTIAPLLAGGEGTHGEALRIVAGDEFDPPRTLRLLGALESDSQLLLRYEVCA
jgi:riboflavin-specific deaminase-like protein